MKLTVEIELHGSEEVPQSHVVVIAIIEDGYTVMAQYRETAFNNEGFWFTIQGLRITSDFKWYYPPITKNMAFKD